MMATYVVRGTFRDVEALRPVLTGGEDTYAELQRQLTLFERRRLRIGGLLGFAFFCLSAEFAVERWTRLLAGDWSLRAICIIAAASAFWIIFGRVTVYLIDSARVYSRTGEQQVTVDLLDLAPLSRLTRHGLRIALLLTIGAAAPAVTLSGAATFVSASPMAPAFLAWLWLVALAAAAFVLPVRGLRRQIRARKAEELARVREDIRLDNDLVARRGPDSAEAGGRLPGLLAYKHEIESVREWPFDAPTLTRFFLYVAIPLGSWIGGALVERLLGAALD
jgi:hypothetical protein